MIQRRDLLKKSAAVLASAPVLTVGAQSYPSRPVRLIVGFAPGGANDILARVYATKMQNVLQQPVVVENKPGANSIIAAEYVAKSAPDGYTLLVASNGLMTINPAIYPRLNYDPARDFDVIGAFAYYPYVVISKAGAGLDDIASLRAAAATRELTHGVGSSVFQLTSEYLARQSGMKILHVPYRGSAPAINDLLGGQVQSMFDNTPSALPHVRGGKLRAIAITSAQRSPLLPDVPTLAESGFPGFDVQSWFGLAAPAGTPRPVVNRINAELSKVLASPDVRERLVNLAATPSPGTPEAFRSFAAAEVKRWRDVVKLSGAKAE